MSRERCVRSLKRKYELTAFPAAHISCWKNKGFWKVSHFHSAAWQLLEKGVTFLLEEFRNKFARLWLKRRRLSETWQQYLSQRQSKEEHKTNDFLPQPRREKTSPKQAASRSYRNNITTSWFGNHRRSGKKTRPSDNAISQPSCGKERKPEQCWWHKSQQNKWPPLPLPDYRKPDSRNPTPKQGGTNHYCKIESFER